MKKVCLSVAFEKSKDKVHSYISFLTFCCVCSHCQISARFLKPDKKTADLVGNEKLKASASVRHLVLPCTRQARAQIIPDIIHCYSWYVAFLSHIFIVFLFCTKFSK